MAPLPSISSTESPHPTVVLIAGGSGLIGTALSQSLLNLGAQVRILSRSAPTKAVSGSNPTYFSWDPRSAVMDPAALQGVTHLVNLAGSGIADKAWTSARRRDLLLSRTQSVDCLAAALQRASEQGAPCSAHRHRLGHRVLRERGGLGHRTKPERSRISRRTNQRMGKTQRIDGDLGPAHHVAHWFGSFGPWGPPASPPPCHQPGSGCLHWFRGTMDVLDSPKRHGAFDRACNV